MAQKTGALIFDETADRYDNTSLQRQSPAKQSTISKQNIKRHRGRNATVSQCLLLQDFCDHQFDTFGIVEGVHISCLAICTIRFHLQCAPPQSQIR